MVSVLAGSTISDTSSQIAKMQIGDTIQRRSAKRFIPAPGHIALSEGGGGPDIGLIEVDIPYRWTKWVQPAPLPFVSDTATEPPPAGFVCQTMGWGHMQPVPTAQQRDEGAEDPDMYPSFVLNVVDLPILAFDECRNYYETIHRDHHLCTLAKGKDACNGDSGGPMICDGMQVAIVMAGDGCAQPGAPGAFSRLPPQLRWIRSVTNYELSHGRTVSVRQIIPFFNNNNNNDSGNINNPISAAIGAFQNGVGMFQNGVEAARNASQQAVSGGLGQAHQGVDMLGAAVNAGISAAFAVVSTFANVFLRVMQQGGELGAGLVPPAGGLPLPFIG